MSAPNSKHIAIVLSRPPYGEAFSRAGIELALAAAVYDQRISLIFLGDGVWQLLDNQQPEALAAKHHSKPLNSLALYGIETLLVDQQALSERQITREEMPETAEILDREQIAELIDSADTVLNF